MSKIKKLARKVVPRGAMRVAENTYRINKARAAVVLHGSPAKHLKIIAVTGTNGKTTTCACINEILKAAGYKTALFTTAFTELAGKREANLFHVTVVHVWRLQKFMAQAKAAGVDWVVLEVSSHALDQHKLLGIPIEAAVLTNLTQEHLDYHGTMQDYAAAKLKLFTNFKSKFAILNADDKWYDYFATKIKLQIFTVGQAKATNEIKSVKLSANGSEFNLIGKRGVLKLRTNLVGEFNVYNVAQAAVVCQVLGVAPEQIENGIKKVDLVPGRMEPVNADQPFAVLVDYAVTPDALANVLTTLKKVTSGKVRLVFGATGDRDKSKRPVMGEVAAKYADVIYLTDDETYTEDGNAIRSAVRAGIIKAGGQNKFVEIADRLEAIKQALVDAKPNDSVVLTGIGHEDYRNMGGKKIPWDERVVAREILQEITAKTK